jgi:hypothetical protein
VARLVGDALVFLDDPGGIAAFGRGAGLGYWRSSGVCAQLASTVEDCPCDPFELEEICMLKIQERLGYSGVLDPAHCQAVISVLTLRFQHFRIVMEKVNYRVKRQWEAKRHRINDVEQVVQRLRDEERRVLAKTGPASKVEWRKIFMSLPVPGILHNLINLLQPPYLSMMKRLVSAAHVGAYVMRAECV